MSQSLSAAMNYPGTNYDAGVPSQTDLANIVEAFADYHYGPDFSGDFNNVGGIEGHLRTVKNTTNLIESDITDINNELSSVSGSIGTLSSNLSASVSVLNQKLKAITVNALTSSAPYTVQVSDMGCMVTYTNTVNITFTLSSSLDVPVGSFFQILQRSSGRILVSGSGVTVNGTPATRTRAQWAYATVMKVTDTSWVVMGDTAA